MIISVARFRGVQNAKYVTNDEQWRGTCGGGALPRPTPRDSGMEGRGFRKARKITGVAERTGYVDE